MIGWKRLENQQEEQLVTQIRLATHAKAAPLYLVFASFPGSGEKMLEDLYLVIKVTGTLKTLNAKCACHGE